MICKLRKGQNKGLRQTRRRNDLEGCKEGESGNNTINNSQINDHNNNYYDIINNI